MLAGKALLALVDVLRAVDALVSRRTRTDVAAVDGGGVAHGSGMAWVAGTRVVEVTQQPSLARRALAQEGSHAVYAGGTVEASRPGAVVDILGTVVSRPPVDTDAGEPSVGVGARRSILTYGRSDSTLVHVLRAEGTREGRGTCTCVRVDPVHASGSVLTLVVVAVVDVHLTVATGEPCGALALVVQGVSGLAGATVVAG